MNTRDDFEVICTNAGQAYQLSSVDMLVPDFDVLAAVENAGYVRVGGPSTSLTRGIPLWKDDVKTYAPREYWYNLKDFWVVAENAGEKVWVIYG